MNASDLLIYALIPLIRCPAALCKLDAVLWRFTSYLRYRDPVQVIGQGFCFFVLADCDSGIPERSVLGNSVVQKWREWRAPLTRGQRPGNLVPKFKAQGECLGSCG